MLGDMEVKEAGMEKTRKIFALEYLSRPKRGRIGRIGWNGKAVENGEEGSVCLENLKIQNHQIQGKL